jgi:hypothetical protein
MPWYQSFENISKLIILLAGIVLLFLGNVETGSALLLSTGVLHTANAVDKKKNGKAAMMILLAAILFMGTTGCGMLHKLPSEVIDLNMQVYDIHDSYVMKDQALNDVEKQELLRPTVILREVMKLLQEGIDVLDILKSEKKITE